MVFFTNKIIFRQSLNFLKRALYIRKELFVSFKILLSTHNLKLLQFKQHLHLSVCVLLLTMTNIKLHMANMVKSTALFTRA